MRQVYARERMPMTLDVSNAPLFVATFVFDGTGIRRMSGSQRKLQADWTNDHRAAIKRLNRGCGFAFDCPFTRGLLRTVHWLSPPPYPYAIFSTRDEAFDWCSQPDDASVLDSVSCGWNLPAIKRRSSRRGSDAPMLRSRSGKRDDAFPLHGCCQKPLACSFDSAQVPRISSSSDRRAWRSATTVEDCGRM